MEGLWGLPPWSGHIPTGPGSFYGPVWGPGPTEFIPSMRPPTAVGPCGSSSSRKRAPTGVELILPAV